ncbi:MAG: hypothetical protein M1503_03570 [Thaumarchaeota archaeon]|nr:hypothetical protein [Nitrososphaerota archaeon]MCL5317332.1 hypothetical protein [Nitrososphaerota archaeon]
MVRRTIVVRNVDDDIWIRFNQAVYNIYGTPYGHIGEELTHAMDQYLAHPQQHHQSTRSAKSQVEKNDHRADVQENIERLRVYFRTLVIVDGDDHTNKRKLVRDIYNCLKDHREHLDIRTPRVYAERLIRLGHIQSNPLAPISLFYDRDWLKITEEEFAPPTIHIPTIGSGTAGQRLKDIIPWNNPTGSPSPLARAS